MRHISIKLGITTTQFVLTCASIAFSLISIAIVFSNGGGLFDVFYCLATIPFVCLPPLLCIIFKWHLNNVFYTVFTLYALGPLLGAVYGLYYVTSWWDDLLHGLAGAIFAICGAYLARHLNRKSDTSYALCIVFGVCFSLGIAVFWEFFEFGSDMLLGSDMQTDTIIHTIVTKIGRTDGGVSIFGDIHDVIVDGTPLDVGGYIDIGLIDTMRDMAVETFGTLVYMVYALIDRDRHPFIVPHAKG